VRHHRGHAGNRLPLGSQLGSVSPVLLTPRPPEGDERQGERHER